MDFSGFIVIAAVISTVILTMALAVKMQRAKELQTTADGLQKSLNEMDEQAKLVVRTDIALNKTQEELDKKITGLYALQRISRAISTTMEEKEIFKRIGSEHLDEIGFERAAAFMLYEEEDKFIPELSLGYGDEEMENLSTFINAHGDFFRRIIGNKETFSSISATATAGINKENLSRAFGINAFVVCPILPKEGNQGLLIVGTENPDTLVTEGDEELITILANQLGQALENARLFEKTWRAQQDLEKKVDERTRELSKVLEEVKDSSKRKSDFISSVSHELRTPLTSIKGYASILLAGKLGAIPKEVKERLEKINRHSDELVHMVNDLLDIARIEAGRVTMKQEPQNLINIVGQATDLLSMQAKEKDINLISDIPSDANSVYVDRSQIERVFINLIANALKFTPAKGRISIRAHKKGSFVQVDINDTGCGIPKEAQDKIFEEFYRVDNAINQEAKGTGLGLSLVKHIIEAHKGKIFVESAPGRGSTFSFTIPRPK